MISTQELVNLFTKKQNVNRRTAITAITAKPKTTIATNTIATNTIATDTNTDTNSLDINIVYTTPSTRNRNPAPAPAPAPAPTQNSISTKSTSTKSTSTKTKSTSTNTVKVKTRSIAIQVNPPKEKKQKPEVCQCPICYKNINDKKNMVVTKCGHKFCSKCIFDYLKSNDNGNKCPMCRATYAPSMETQAKFTDRQVTNTIKLHLDEIILDNSNTLEPRDDIIIRNPNNGRIYNILTRAPEFSEILSQSPYEVKHANYLKLYDKMLHKFIPTPTNHNNWENHNEFVEVLELLMDTIQDSIMQFSDSLGVTDV
jgi:hypothetical protein